MTLGESVLCFHVCAERTGPARRAHAMFLDHNYVLCWAGMLGGSLAGDADDDDAASPGAFTSLTMCVHIHERSIYRDPMLRGHPQRAFDQASVCARRSVPDATDSFDDKPSWETGADDDGGGDLLE
jgi:hypothetical protein